MARKLSLGRPIALEPLEREFVRITLDLFDFLVSEWGCRSDVSGAGSFEIAVVFRNEQVAVEVMFSEESWIIPKVIPLRRGKMPEWFDGQLKDLFTGFPLEMFFELVDPSWQRPKHQRVVNAQDIQNELSGYASEFREQGQPLLTGDQVVFDQMESRMRQRLIAIHLKDWTRFVERVRTGFDGPITEFVEAVVGRSQLDSVLTIWKGDRADDPILEIERLDRVFEEYTEPLAWGAGRNIVLPTPNAKRWWRRPKWLTGSLRDYFATHGDTSV
jgi:hypothetical protein